MNRDDSLDAVCEEVTATPQSVGERVYTPKELSPTDAQLTLETGLGVDSI